MQPRAAGPQEIPVESEIASEQAYSVISPSAEHRPSVGDRAGLQATAQLSGSASLVAITLLSIGLWVAIWAGRQLGGRGLAAIN